MKKIILSCLIAVTMLVSCDRDSELRKGSGTNTTLAAFASNSVDFPVEIGTTGFGASTDVVVNVSSAASTDRTFNVNVVPDNTNADPANYMVPATVTIPAGAFSGNLTLTGQDTNLETTPTQIELELVSPDAGTSAGPNTIVNIFQVCPVDNTFFTGDYQMTHLIFNGFGVPTFGFAKIVTLANGNGNTARQFVAPYAPDLGAFSDRTWTFTLSCNEVAWAANQDAAVGCGGAAPNIELTTADAAFGNGTYDPADDASFTMNFVDDNLDDCGARTNVSILMTKQ